MWTIFKKSVNHLRQPEQKRAVNNQKYYKTVRTLPFSALQRPARYQRPNLLWSLKSWCRRRQLRWFWFVKPRHKQTSWKFFLQRCVSCEHSHRVQNWNFKLQYLFNSPRYILWHFAASSPSLQSLLNILDAVIRVSSAWYAGFRQKARFPSQPPLISHRALVSFLFEPPQINFAPLDLAFWRCFLTLAPHWWTPQRCAALIAQVCEQHELLRRQLSLYQAGMCRKIQTIHKVTCESGWSHVCTFFKNMLTVNRSLKAHNRWFVSGGGVLCFGCPAGKLHFLLAAIDSTSSSSSVRRLVAVSVLFSSRSRLVRDRDKISWQVRNVPLRLARQKSNEINNNGGVYCMFRIHCHKFIFLYATSQ